MMNAQGEEKVKKENPPNNGEIIEFFRGFSEPVVLAMEATRSWYWLYDPLEQNEIEVKLSHPPKTRAIASARVKNDKIDSRILAYLLRAGLLPLSYVLSKPIRMQREFLYYRACGIVYSSYDGEIMPLLPSQSWQLPSVCSSMPSRG